MKPSARSKTKRTPSLQLTLGKAKSSRSQPANATTTRVNAVSTGSVSSPSQPDSEITAELQAERNKTPHLHHQHDATGDSAKSSIKNTETPILDDSTVKKPTTAEENQVVTGNGGPSWLGWLSRPTAEPQRISNSAPPSLSSPEPPLPPQELPPFPQALIADMTEFPPVPGESRPIASKRGWLQMWSGASARGGSNTEETQIDPNFQNSGDTLTGASADTNSSPASGSQALSAEPSQLPTLPGDGPRSSGWVFWSRDRKANNSSPLAGEARVGEIAMSDTPSQKHPTRTSVSLENPKPAVASGEPNLPVGRGPKTAQAKGIGILQPKDIRPPTPTQNVSQAQKAGTTTPTSATLPAHDIGASKQSQISAPNLLFPSFSETFTLQEAPSMFQLLGRLLNYNRLPEDKHLHRVKEVPKLKSALAIGVHGYFPNPFIRTVLGQPTGTSIKFADMAAKAIRKWTECRGYRCEVKTAALEGEGRIAERVDLLWKLLLNWIDEIRKSDFVMIACHSQGVPVAMMLVAKLIDFGCINTARVGICAMAGVSLGPFADYKSRWISGSAGELFDFSNSSSTVSKDYLTAVETALKFGVRLVYIGSIDDQLVSLESSTFSPVSHPHIYRAVFVDGRIHAPNFLVHLVGFALKLRNLGVQDHGLIRELSGPLAGSLYTGEGHSRIYEEDAVYDLAVQFALETNAIMNAPLSQKPSPSPSSNPYILPWAVRGILEEDFVKADLREEVDELLKQFDEWTPTTKVLKDVKFRLEGIRSKL